MYQHIKITANEQKWLCATPVHQMKKPGTQVPGFFTNSETD